MGNQVKAIQNVATNLQKAEEVGMDEEFWARMRSDVEFAKRMGNHARTGGFDSATQGDQPYFGTSMQVFGWEEWVAFTKAHPNRHKAEIARSTFPWQTGDLNDPYNHFSFFSQGSAKFLVTPTQSIELPLTIENLHLFSQECVNWSGRPKIVFEEEISASELDWIDPPANSWITICKPMRCKPQEIPEKYELATATEYLLGLILYYQKYGNLNFFTNGNDQISEHLVTASRWTKWNHDYRVGLWPSNSGIWVYSATPAVAIHQYKPDQIFWWALKRKLPAT